LQSLTKSDSFVKGIALSSTFNLVSKFTVFGYFIFVTYYFGAQGKTDIYWFLYNTLWQVIAVFYSLNIAVIIPEAMRRREQEGRQSGMRFFTFFFYFFLLAAVCGLLVIYALDPVWLLSKISKYRIETLESYRNLITWFAPIFPIMLMVSYLSSLLNAYRYFTIPVLTGLINNLVTLVFLVVLHKYLDIYALLAAVYAGNIFNLGRLLYIMRRDLSWNFLPQWVKVNKLYRQNFVMGLLGNVGNFFGKFAVTYFTSGASPGLLTAFTYGKKAADIPGEVVTDQFSAVAAIRINELTAQQEKERRKSVFMKSTRMLIFILTPIAAFFFFFGEPIIALLFQRGAFGVEEVQHTGIFLRYLGLLIPLYGINTMVTRLYNAGQIIKFSVIYNIFANILMIALLWIGYAYWGIWGLPFALLIQNLLNVLVAELFIYLFFREINYYKVLGYFMGVLALSVVVCGSLYVLSGFLLWSWWVKLPLVGLLFVGVYVGINERFVINSEASEYVRKMFPVKRPPTRS